MNQSYIIHFVPIVSALPRIVALGATGMNITFYISLNLHIIKQ